MKSYKQLRPEQWKYFFELYETDVDRFYFEYFELRGKTKTKNKMRVFRRKYQNYIYNNCNIEVLMSNTGKSTNKFKKLNKQSNTKKSDKELIKNLIDSLPEDIVNEIFKIGIDNIKEKRNDKHKDVFNKIIKTSKLSLRKLERILNISKSHISRIRNNWVRKQKEVNENELKIIEIFDEFKSTIGREPVTEYARTRYGITLSSRQIGRILVRNHRKSEVRTKKQTYKELEFKNTNVDIPNLVWRDNDNKFHDEIICATDTSYIESPSDVKGNHVYLSICINHKNKQIIGWKLSTRNDRFLAIDTIKNIDLENVIIHSDHGGIYSTPEFIYEINKKKNWKQSMGRVGNSLDNREVEHLFGIIKTELIYRINVKKLTFKELETLISNWIDYYNNRRIQKKLNWCAPAQV